MYEKRLAFVNRHHLKYVSLFKKSITIVIMIMTVMMVLWVMVTSMVSLVIIEISAYTTTIPTLTNTRFQTTRIPRIQPQIRPSKFAIFTVFSSTNDSSNNSGGGLVQQTDSIMKKQLLNAFTNLGTADQYDAVLTGLCAKVLDDTNAITPDTTIVAIQDCTDLLEEMNASKITASSRSLMALIDVSVLVFSPTRVNRKSIMFSHHFSAVSTS